MNFSQIFSLSSSDNEQFLYFSNQTFIGDERLLTRNANCFDALNAEMRDFRYFFSINSVHFFFCLQSLQFTLTMNANQRENE